MTLDEALVDEVDDAAAKLGTTRSGFARVALRQALARVKESDLERKHRDGYRKKPVSKNEFAPWESQQAWGEL
jgi:metal-responsive CopG/Arc/MetJ family transcriptional regulator